MVREIKYFFSWEEVYALLYIIRKTIVAIKIYLQLSSHQKLKISENSATFIVNYWIRSLGIISNLLFTLENRFKSLKLATSQ